MVCEWCNKTEIGQGYFKLINLKPVRELDILQNKISAGDFSWGLEAQVEKKKVFLHSNYRISTDIQRTNFISQNR